MLQLCIPKSDIIQNDTPSTCPVPSEGSASNLSDKSVPLAYLPNAALSQ